MDEIKASPTKPGQELLGKIGQVAEKLGIKVEEAMKIVNQEGNSPVKAFIMNMLVSEPLKSAGTALQDWTGTPRDATEDYPYRRLVSGKGMTASLDPRILDVAPIAGFAASRVAHGIKHLPTDLMKAATAAYGPQATAAHVVKPTDKSIKEMIDEIRKTQGAYEAKRLERAADEVPNLERLYQPEALQSLFRGDNAKGIMTMRPGEFERYATPLDYDPKSPKHFMFGEAVDPVKGSTPKGLTQEQYIQYLSGLKGFEDVPFLEVNKTKSNKLAITGHEGRHRSRALDAAGEKAGLVQFYPRASLREDFPRRHRDEYIDALREELERHGRMVTPQSDMSPEGVIIRPDIELPDVYKGGGPVHKQTGGIMEAIEAAKKSGKPRAKIPLGGRVDIEQMRREVEENARRVAEVRKELAPTETKYSPSLKFLPKGTPESIRYAFEKAAKDAGPSMQVAQVDGKPVGVTSEPGGFGEALSSAGALLDIPSIAAGEEAFTRTGSPALAAAAYTLTDPIGAVLGAPAAGRAAIKGAKALAPKLGETAEQYMFRTGMALPLDVWHGSPHRFPPAAKNPLGEFDPTKIGTGEGAQAYGHGHYLAENTDVAKGYQSTLRERNAWEIDGQRVHGVRSRLDAQPINYAANALERFDGDKKAAIAWLKDSESPWDLEAAQLLAKSKTAQKAPGSLYKVDLPDEQIAKMLDWDKPLSEQPESVQKVLKDLAERDAKMYGEGGGLDYYMSDPESYSGESVYRYLTEQLSGQPETSSFFKEAGIPGIKYFDAASRDAGEGTRNFVVFPGGEEMLTIKERMKDGGVAHKAGGGVLRRLAKYGKQYEPSKKTEIFIGEKSPMWNAGAAGKAVELEKAGVSPVDIWKQTGTFRSPDGALRQEISDVGSKFRDKQDISDLAASMKQQEVDIKGRIAESKLHPDLFPKQLTAAQKELRQQAKDIKARRTMEGGPEQRSYNRAEFALEHPELYKAYPNLSGMDVKQGGTSGSTRASYIEGINENDPGLMNVYDLGLKGDPRSSAIHEMQHAIQGIEDWGRGGNPYMAFQHKEAHDILNALRKQALEPMTYEEYSKKAGLESLPLGDAMKQYEHYKKNIPAMAKKLDREIQGQAANLYYERLSGEAEARAAQARRDLTPEQRLEKFPLEVGDYGYDVKPEDIIVKRQKKGGQVSLDAMRLAVGGGLKSGIKAAKKIGDYVDPKSSKINKWKWRPLGDVQKDIGITEIPEYIQGGFGDLMADQLKRANAGDLSARDFLKAYGITQSSIGREGRSYNTATKAGLKLPKQDYIRPEGAFAEWLGSKAGQRFLDKAEQGVTDENALKQLREQFSPFGMSNALTDRLRWGINYAAENPDIANKFATSSVPDYRDLMLDIKGIGPAKSGFIGSMLGRGDLPTLDARQVLLHTGKYSSHPDFAKFTRPVVGGKPVAANESVDRLIARQEAMDADIDEALEPFYQHLMHHAVWDKAGGSKTTHEDLVRAMKDYKKGGEVSIDAMRLAVGGMAGGGRSSLIRGGIETVSKGLKSAEKAKQYATPAKFERAPAKTKAEVEALAQRMAPQFLGEFVRKPESTFSVAGKSMKQYRREKDLPIVYGGERPTPDVFDITKHEGEMMVGVPGDPTIAHRTLEQIGDIRPDAPVELHGGPLYGLEGEFWASGKGPATGLQAVARRGSEAYGGVPVVGQYIRMPEGTPYALHTTDALLSFQRPEMLGKRKLEQLNAEIRRGNLKNKFPEFVGFEDPDLVLLQAQDNPNLRKHINNVLLKPTTAEKYGLYPGPDIDAAITEAGLRNLETGATGFSVGRLFPESKLIESAHPTYEFDIPGRMIGQTKYPQPYELTFPDALKFAREGLKPGVGEFGMLKMIGPRQIIDAQLVDEINMYQEAMKKLTGKKKGGTIKKAVGGGVMSAGQKLAKAFVEAGKKAKLPEQAKEAASKGELFLPDEEVKRMQRELLQGVKKPEEFAVGGQITSDDLILEERPL